MHNGRVSKQEKYDLIVIGGGASGMIASGRAAALGKRVLLIEKNRFLGAKLKITGGGRCNITNATYDTRLMLSNYGEAADFLFSPFSVFGVKDTFEFFEFLGLPLVVQANNRAFPNTENALDVVRVLTNYMQKGKVEIKLDSAVEQILQAKGEITGILAGGKEYFAKNYILATGGASHPETGSTGDGFSWLRNLGHTVKAPTPTIVPLNTKEEWNHILSGNSLVDGKITFYLDDKKQFAKKGKILFTHFGLSGPLILNSASEVGDLLQAGAVTGKIDCYPTEDIGTLDKVIVKTFESHKNKSLKNTLKEIVPAGMAPGIASLLKDLNLDIKVNSITKEERRKIVFILKNLPITVTGLGGFDRAVVADGGVLLSEIDTKTMRSKLISNLFVTGDLLHINRPSGGYSLQLCWTTGFVAGSSTQ